MDAPIISIYDMMVKRYKKQQKEEQLRQKDLLSGVEEDQLNQIKAGGDRIIETKKLKWKASPTNISTESKDKQSSLSSNVITATHLTKKHTGSLMPPLTKKEVLNQLIERMSGSSKKHEEKPVNNESSGTSPAEDDGNVPIISIKKMKTKPKNLKPVPISASSLYRRRLGLSPRISTMGTPRPKRERPIIKAKPVSNSKALKGDPKTPVSGRSKKRLQVNKSKISIILKKEDIKPIS